MTTCKRSVDGAAAAAERGAGSVGSLRRWLCAALVSVTFAGPGCDDISDLASFLGADFGDITATVTDLRDNQLESLMNDVVLKLRSYLELRELLPFGDLGSQGCMRGFEQVSDSVITFSQDVNCLYGDFVAPADGFIDVRQEQLAVSPVEVIGLGVDYRGVRLGDFFVDGHEEITETIDDDGASIRDVDIVQNEITLKYEFRLGLLDGEVPVFDYVVDVNGGSVRVRISNPTQPGGLVSAQIVGIDGVLSCEVRDTIWTTDEPARGLCDNGQVFGLD